MSLYERIPDYLLGKFQLTSSVVFAALFSLVMMLFSFPFSSNFWFEIAISDAFAFTVGFFLLSLAVVACSKRLMYTTRSNFSMTYLQYIIWNFAEALIIASLYTVFTIVGQEYGILKPVSLGSEKIWLGALVYATFCLGVPYVIAGLYFTVNDKNNTIRLMNFGNVVSDVEPEPTGEKKITLTDNNGLVKLSVSLGNLLFIESDDNYIKVWYRTSLGELKQYMLRCRLKTVEESFADSCLVRCHRKYIVNISNVRFMTKDKNGYLLDLDEESVEPIPVSKTYEDAVLSQFNSR
ncbi:MAG: LytTR family transcriptional regulator [Bacteroidales bacterium]|nr:LytTR family transcriptional regulator [Candidatus Cryptobacteroides fimicaballi]